MNMELITNAVGATDFNTMDRLAVINVLNSYGYFVDELQLDNYFGLFSDSPVVEFWAGDKLITQGWEPFKAMAISRQENFRREKIQRRHVLSAPRFEAQGTDEIRGHVYLRLYKVQEGKASLVTLGYYTFTAIKQRGEWKLHRWVARVDLMPD